MGRKLTDSEVFGFSQVNSEHCRHKIFNGTFVLSGIEKEQTLFQMIKATTKINPNSVISAYKDNCAFVQGPVVEQFAPGTQEGPDFFNVTDYESVLSIKAETHNFPTTVEPFNGASTGTGGGNQGQDCRRKRGFPNCRYSCVYDFLSTFLTGTVPGKKPHRKDHGFIRHLKIY